MEFERVQKGKRAVQGFDFAVRAEEIFIFFKNRNLLLSVVAPETPLAAWPAG